MNEQQQYQLIADAIVFAHLIYVCIVVFGQVFILVGLWRGWRSVRNFWFRAIHLSMIGAVVVQVALGWICPLTEWERHFRELAGEATYTGSFLGRIAHNLLFYDIPQWAFNVAHTIFGAVVLTTFIFAPPRWPGNRS